MPALTREEITAKAAPDDRTMLQFGSPSAVYEYALALGWITELELDEARHHYGAGWRYTGD